MTMACEIAVRCSSPVIRGKHSVVQSRPSNQLLGQSCDVGVRVRACSALILRRLNPTLEIAVIRPEHQSSGREVITH